VFNISALILSPFLNKCIKFKIHIVNIKNAWNILFFFLFNYIIKYNQMVGGVLDLGELVKRAIKYLVEGALVALAAYSIPQRKLNLDEIGLIALVAAATFSILDTYVPTLAVSARSGAGFGIGANLVGFPGNVLKV